MNENERFARAAGICWHEQKDSQTLECKHCGEGMLFPWQRNPDFTDTREVWKIVGKEKDFHKYLYDKGWAIIEKRGAIDLIFLDSRCWTTPASSGTWRRHG